MRRRRSGLPTSRARAAAPLRPPLAAAIRYRPCAQRGLSLPRALGPVELGTPGGGGTKGGGVGTAKRDDGWDDPGPPAGLRRQESVGATADTPCPPRARTPPGPRRDTRSLRCISVRPRLLLPRPQALRAPLHFNEFPGRSGDQKGQDPRDGTLPARCGGAGPHGDLKGGATRGGADACGGRGSQLRSSESSWGRGAGAGARARVRDRDGTRGWAGAGSIDMGSADSKLNFRKAVIQLTTKTQFWADTATSVQDVFALVPAAEIRAVREESPSNLATLCYKAVEKLVQGAESGCHSEKEKQVVLNCSRLLTRVLPYIFEDPDWRGFFWSTVPGAGRGGGEEEDENARPLAESLLLAIADLLFCPDFTVQSHRRNNVDSAEDVHSLDSCEYIWEAGVGFAHSPQPNYIHDMNRMELLKLLLTCFSEAMYLPPSPESGSPNPWVQFFCSTENSLLTCKMRNLNADIFWTQFTSFCGPGAGGWNWVLLPKGKLCSPALLTACLKPLSTEKAVSMFSTRSPSPLAQPGPGRDPVGYGIPYNHLLFSDYREPLVEEAAQVLIVTLDHDSATSTTPTVDGTTTGTAMEDADPPGPENLFVNYLSRIHREEDFQFILKGIARLLSNPLLQTYLPNSTKKIQFHQELLVLFWKLCDFNKKFLFFVLKSSDVLDILVPILYFLNDARADQSRVGLMHIGVFILLLLSGERNFGVRLNKPYSVRVPMDIPVFTGTHADLLIVVFHKIITSGHQRLQPLFDCLLTIVVNVSPYLKSLSMVTANKLLHLLEAFSTTWFLFSASQNHHLVFLLLEVFNNIIQYQFDGNSNLVYAIIRKRGVFHQLANLPTDPPSIHKALQRRRKTPEPLSRAGSQEGASMEGSRPAAPAEPGTLKTSLVATPGIDKLTEKSQVSEDGTLRSLEPESQPSSVEGSPSEGILSWKSKLPLQTIMRLLQVLVPQVEKICIDKGLTDESEILRFLQHGTLVGLLPVPHPILIRKYQANSGTAMWFRTYMWGVIYLRNVDPPIWYDTDVKLFEIQRV
ncbi:Protein HID1 [Microtus ochrogaster]|uniref:Protein HID1 n=1 Tax=Microtus ochrogaster TaxID=79684 RepID=A0A8J6GXK7_MICOH|nr:Protein HID1 [Microtus ochrogaster]